MGHESVIAELRRARDDEDVAAVVFRVDSPGGVGLDSDLIGHEVELLKEVKPVVVSMVNVAASGGYAISYRASKIVADSMTVTGSIGSISGKFNVRDLYGRFGVTVDSVTKGPNALMNSSFHDYTPEQRARFEEDHWKGFNYWLADVAKFRGMTFEEAEALAHGRVWTGLQAKENGLIDEVGDLQRAIEVAKELAEVPADEQVTLVHYPEKKSLFQLVTGDDGEVAAAARWAVYRQLRTELSTTWEMIEQNPELAAEVLAP
jgi:protease-4